MTEKEKVLYDVAAKVYSTILSGGEGLSGQTQFAIEAWNAAEVFYAEMAKRLELEG